MRPTRVRVLVAIVAITAAIGWGVVQVVEAWAGRLIPVPWLAAAAMWLLAAAVLYWAFTSRPRLQRRPGSRPMAPIVAARSAALAMAASRTGALVGGFYGGVAIGMIPAVGTPSGAETLWAAALAALGSAVLVVSALWLEHLCRLPIGPPTDLGE